MRAIPTLKLYAPLSKRSGSPSRSTPTRSVDRLTVLQCPCHFPKIIFRLDPMTAITNHISCCTLLAIHLLTMKYLFSRFGWTEIWFSDRLSSYAPKRQPLAYSAYSSVTTFCNPATNLSYSYPFFMRNIQIHGVVKNVLGAKTLNTWFLLIASRRRH